MAYRLHRNAAAAAGILSGHLGFSSRTPSPLSCRTSSHSASAAHQPNAVATQPAQLIAQPNRLPPDQPARKATVHSALPRVIASAFFSTRRALPSTWGASLRSFRSALLGKARARLRRSVFVNASWCHCLPLQDCICAIAAVAALFEPVHARLYANCFARFEEVQAGIVRSLGNPWPVPLSLLSLVAGRTRFPRAGVHGRLEGKNVLGELFRALVDLRRVIFPLRARVYL